jgi:hypothetical protein
MFRYASGREIASRRVVMLGRLVISRSCSRLTVDPDPVAVKRSAISQPVAFVNEYQLSTSGVISVLVHVPVALLWHHIARIKGHAERASRINRHPAAHPLLKRNGVRTGNLASSPYVAGAAPSPTGRYREHG